MNLRAAGDAQEAGHDLLPTHIPPRGATSSAAYSRWAPVIASQPATSAVLGGLAGYARQVAPVAAQVATPGRAGLPDLIGFGTPALVIAAVAGALLFLLAEAIWWLPGRHRKSIEAFYQDQYRQRKIERKEEPGPGDPELWEVSAVQPPAGDDDSTIKWVRKIARAHRLGHASRDVGWLLWILSIFELATVIITVALHPAINPDRWLGKAAITIGTLLPLFLVGLLRAGWAQPTKRRQIGVLWDVGTFWPRSYHPLAPPCYAERAVPDLQRRLWWLNDNDGSVLLAAHSQGSVLAAAALIQKDRLPDDDRTALVTFGSPLGKLYSWAFPAYVNEDQLKHLVRDSERSWKNIYYPTDPIGGRYSTARRTWTSSYPTRRNPGTTTANRSHRRADTSVTGPMPASGVR